MPLQSGRVWRKVPESDARSVIEDMSGDSRIYLVLRVEVVIRPFFTGQSIIVGPIDKAGPPTSQQINKFPGIKWMHYYYCWVVVVLVFVVIKAPLTN